MSRIDIHAV